MTATLAAVEANAGPVRLDRGDREDADLARRVAEGDESALASLYDRYAPRCFGLALRISANRQLAEEVVQEAFLALWKTNAYSERAGALRSWLLALVHHKAVDAVRRESSLGRRQSAYSTRDLASGGRSPDPETTAWETIRDGEVRAALDDLSDGQREAVVLAYFGGHTQREISEMTGVPLGTVKTRTFSAMRRLQDRLSGVADLPERGRP